MKQKRWRERAEEMKEDEKSDRWRWREKKSTKREHQRRQEAARWLETQRWRGESTGPVQLHGVGPGTRTLPGWTRSSHQPPVVLLFLEGPGKRLWILTEPSLPKDGHIMKNLIPRAPWWAVTVSMVTPSLRMGAVEPWRS